MTIRNPITDEKFEDKKQGIESLIESYKKVKKELYNLAQDESALLEEFNKLCPADEKGTFPLEGTSQVAKATKDINASYPKDKGEQHPLRALMQIYPELGDMIRMTYQEAGSAIDNLIDRHKAGTPKPGDNPELAQALIRVRSTSPAKLKILIEDAT